MRAAVIINPIAGVKLPGDTPERRVALAGRVLARHEVDGVVRVSERAGHAAELAGEAVASGCGLVIAWGGDGTINEVAGALINRPAALGIVPSGSGNGLAHSLGLPIRPAAALARALTGTARRIDVGELGGRRFFNVAGIGFDAAVAARFNRLGHTRGLLAYVHSVAPRFLSYKALPCVLEADDEKLDRPVLMVTIANSREFGGHAVIAPAARPDDGLLDLVVIPDRSPVDRLSLVPHVFAGTLDRVPGVLMRRVTRVRVASDCPLAFHTDGEPHDGATELEARVFPGALAVQC